MKTLISLFGLVYFIYGATTLDTVGVVFSLIFIGVFSKVVKTENDKTDQIKTDQPWGTAILASMLVLGLIYAVIDLITWVVSHV